MKTENRNERKSIKKQYILLRIILFFLLIPILFFAPDFIIFFRNLLIGKLNLKLNSQLNSLSYIQIMISIFTCAITAILSTLTYRLTKMLRTIEAERYDAKLATSAFRLRKNIKENCWIIFNAHKNVVPIDELQYLADLDEAWFLLLASNKLDNDDLDYLEKYNNKIKEIFNRIGTTDSTKELEMDFCRNFLRYETQFEYSEQTEKLINKLEKIMGRKIEDE